MATHCVNIRSALKPVPSVLHNSCYIETFHCNARSEIWHPLALPPASAQLVRRELSAIWRLAVHPHRLTILSLAIAHCVCPSKARWQEPSPTSLDMRFTTSFASPRPWRHRILAESSECGERPLDCYYRPLTAFVLLTQPHIYRLFGHCSGVDSHTFHPPFHRPPISYPQDYLIWVKYALELPP